MALNIFNQAADYVLTEWFGPEKFTEDQVDLVADLMQQANSVWTENESYGVLLLEKAASYVQADMNEAELSCWTNLCTDSIAYYTDL